MTKLKITDEEFKRFYEDHTADELADKFGAGISTIYHRARKLGLFKNKHRIDPDIIPGGLPDETL